MTRGFSSCAALCWWAALLCAVGLTASSPTLRGEESRVSAGLHAGPWSVRREDAAPHLLGLPAGTSRILPASRRKAFFRRVAAQGRSPLVSSSPANRTSGSPRLQEGEDPAYRLPTHVVPFSQELTVDVDMEALKFTVVTTIYVNVLKDTSTVVLHAAPNLILGGKETVNIYQYATDGSTQWGEVTSMARDDVHETVTLTMSKPLTAGNHFTITFNEVQSKLQDDLSGFYWSSYKTASGETRWQAVTQFESTLARRAFPCFDEPIFKARFLVTIIHPEKYSARSNMPVDTSSPASVAGRVKTVFQMTVPMSTYILAWVVSDFKSLSNEDGSFNTWAREEIVAGGALSQQHGPKVLEQMAAYTGQAYVMPKTDQFAIPDFGAGAMENWGIITYREPFLISLPETTNVALEMAILGTICHELSHQWNGNLVTMEWWSDTWLNEGFAAFFEGFICDQVDPKLKAVERSIPDSLHIAMTTDVTDTVSAMSSPVSTFDEIEDKFDDISYAKGGSVLRMFQHILTPPVFQKGLQQYFASNMFKNTNPTHLFRALDAVAREHGGLLPPSTSFATVAETWTTQKGYPLVTVERDYDKGTATLSQERFSPTGESVTKNKWYVPIAVTSAKSGDFSQTRPSHWLTPSETTINITVDATADQWVLVNPQQTGYYMVNYDAENWGLLLQGLVAEDSPIPATSRAQLLHDSFQLALAGQLSWDKPLMMLEMMRSEREVAVWLTALDIFVNLQEQLTNTDAYHAYLTLIKAYSSSAYEAVGYQVLQDDTYDRRFLRFTVMPLACTGGNDLCLKDTSQALEQWLLNPTEHPLHPDIKILTGCSGLNGDSPQSQANFIKLLDLVTKMHKEGDTTVDEYIANLGCTSNQKNFEYVDNLLRDVSDPGRFDLYYKLVSSFIEKPYHHQFMKTYFQEKWREIEQFFSVEGSSSGTEKLIELLSAWIATIHTDEEYQEVKHWIEETFANHIGYSNLQEALQGVNSALDAWYRKHYREVAAWIFFLSGETPPTPPQPTPPPTQPTRPPTAPPTQPTPPPTAGPSTTNKPSSANAAQTCLALLLGTLLHHAVSKFITGQ